MKNYTGKLVDAYYTCLNGDVMYGGRPVPVYNTAVSADERGHHIIVRAESESDASNKSSFVTNPTVIVEVVTIHDGAIDPSITDDIDDGVRQSILPTRSTTGLGSITGVQVLNVTAQSSTYLDGFNGRVHEHRKITRFTNRLNQI